MKKAVRDCRVKNQGAEKRRAGNFGKIYEATVEDFSVGGLKIRVVCRLAVPA
jgi:hypothetical protein